jgi:hypothetical protein
LKALLRCFLDEIRAMKSFGLDAGDPTGAQGKKDFSSGTLLQYRQTQSKD